MRRRIRSAAPPLHRHTLVRLAVDGTLLALAYYLAFQLRFNNGPTGYYAHLRDRTVWWVLGGSLPVLVLARVYRRRWRYSGQRDYEAVVRGVLAVVALTVVAVAVLRPVERTTHHGTSAIGLPNGVIVLFALLSLAFLLGVRAIARSVHERRPLAAFRGGRKGERRVLIAGAGEGGRLVLREILRNRGLGLAPVGFLDDDPDKRGLRIDGVRVRGNTEGDLSRILDESEPDEVIIAIPSAPGSTRARIVRACRTRGVPVRTLPTVFELLQTRGALARQMREVRVEDVLGREPVVMELDGVSSYLAGATVLVTGAGGSIGSELCRQIARLEPHRMVLLDHAEDNLFAIQRELEEERHVSPSMLAAVLADCKEEERMREVLGSSGSVVPVFRRQIERGGPVTVTDERMTRYFMTIPEAVQLIIRTGSVACPDPERSAPGVLSSLVGVGQPDGRHAGAEVFVLDMGEPVRILDLARAMIELSGLDPDRDIEIEIVGRRPGEKLHEELFNGYERSVPTGAEKIMRAEREPLGAQAAESMFSEIGLLVLEGDAAGLAAKVSELSALHVEAQANGGRRRAQRRPERLDGGIERALDAPAALLHSPDS